jgi:hypothetical protein
MATDTSRATNQMARPRLHRVVKTDHTDALLSLAAGVLIIGAGTLVVRELYDLVRDNRFSLFDGLYFSGESLSHQFGRLVPALAAFVVRACRRPLLKLRVLLRIATVISAGCTLLMVGRALTQFSTLTYRYERQLLVLSALRLVAFVAANLAIVFDDRERLS